MKLNPEKMENFEKLLDARPELSIQLLEITPETLSADEFEKLHLEMESLRAAILAGHQATISEMRQIVLYFRHRRGRLFTVAKAGKKSSATAATTGKAKKPPVRRKTAKEVDIQDLLKLIG
jgi:hypothetical protein